MRKLINIHGHHHAKADLEHLCAPIKKGGRGQMHLEGTYISEITKLVEYMDSKENPLIQILEHTNTSSA